MFALQWLHFAFPVSTTKAKADCGRNRFIFRGKTSAGEHTAKGTDRNTVEPLDKCRKASQKALKDR